MKKSGTTVLCLLYLLGFPLPSPSLASLSWINEIRCDTIKKITKHTNEKEEEEEEEGRKPVEKAKAGSEENVANALKNFSWVFCPTPYVRRERSTTTRRRIKKKKMATTTTRLHVAKREKEEAKRVTSLSLLRYQTPTPSSCSCDPVLVVEEDHAWKHYEKVREEELEWTAASLVESEEGGAVRGGPNTIAAQKKKKWLYSQKNMEWGCGGIRRGVGWCFCFLFFFLAVVEGDESAFCLFVCCFAARLKV